MYSIIISLRQQSIAITYILSRNIQEIMVCDEKMKRNLNINYGLFLDHFDSKKRQSDLARLD